MEKKEILSAIEKTDVGFIVALLKIFTDYEARWKPKEIRALAEQMLVLWFRVKNPAKFHCHMDEFFEKSQQLKRPVQHIGRLMARELCKQEDTHVDG